MQDTGLRERKRQYETWFSPNSDARTHGDSDNDLFRDFGKDDKEILRRLALSPAGQRGSRRGADPQLWMRGGRNAFLFLASCNASLHGAPQSREVGRRRKHLEHALIEIRVAVRLPAAERGAIAARGG